MSERPPRLEDFRSEISERKVAAQRGDPFAFRAGPARAAQVDTTAAVEADAFGVQQRTLPIRTEDVATGTDAAGRIDHPLPGDDAMQHRRQHAQRLPNGACGAGVSEDGRDLPVGNHLATRHSPHDAIHQPMELRRVIALRTGSLLPQRVGHARVDFPEDCGGAGPCQLTRLLEAHREAAEDPKE